jgi:hypothetical protein
MNSRVWPRPERLWQALRGNFPPAPTLLGCSRVPHLSLSVSSKPNFRPRVSTSRPVRPYLVSISHFCGATCITRPPRFLAFTRNAAFYCRQDLVFALTRSATYPLSGPVLCSQGAPRFPGFLLALSRSATSYLTPYHRSLRRVLGSRDNSWFYLTFLFLDSRADAKSVLHWTTEDPIHWHIELMMEESRSTGCGS